MATAMAMATVMSMSMSKRQKGNGNGNDDGNGDGNSKTATEEQKGDGKAWQGKASQDKTRHGKASNVVWYGMANVVTMPYGLQLILQYDVSCHMIIW
jgi:hypothetical protein